MPGLELTRCHRGRAPHQRSRTLQVHASIQVQGRAVSPSELSELKYKYPQLKLNRHIRELVSHVLLLISFGGGGGGAGGGWGSSSGTSDKTWFRVQGGIRLRQTCAKHQGPVVRMPLVLRTETHRVLLSASPS